MHPLPTKLGDGEWSIFWEGMDGSPTLDEGYGSLAGGGEEPNSSLNHTLEENVVTPNLVEDASPAPAMESLDDSFFERIFEDRTVVQTPTKILPPLVSSSPTSPSTAPQKLSAFFLFSNLMPVPSSVTIRFIPTWTSPIAPLPRVTVPVVSAPAIFSPGDLHRSWAKSRLADLNELQELADELAGTGQRGVGTGAMKVGVDGGGHDEDRVRWEAEMVGRERNWVLKRFLGKVLLGKPLDEERDSTGKSADEDDLTEEREIERGLQMLEKLAEGLKISTDEEGVSLPAPQSATAFTIPQACTVPSATSDDDDDDLFALPLSPRSPEMGVSPFSFGNLDSAILAGISTEKNHAGTSSFASTTTSKNAIRIGGGAAITPKLMGSPNPEEMRKKRLVSNMPSTTNV